MSRAEIVMTSSPHRPTRARSGSSWPGLSVAPGTGVAEQTRSAARIALNILGLHPVRRLVPLASVKYRPTRRTVRATVVNERGRTDVAVKVVLDPEPETVEAFAWEHRVTAVMSAVAEALITDGVIARNPVVPVVHDRPIDLGHALVSVSQFVGRTGAPLRASAWGETLALLHLIGSTPPARALLAERPRTNILAGLNAGTFLSALERPGHPFRTCPDLVLDLVRTLRSRARFALDLDPVPLLVHRDLHALNCLPTDEGPVVIDWQDAGWGSRSDDFAWTYLLERRLHHSPAVLDTALRAYADITGVRPTRAQITASGQVRELLCLAYSIQNADRSPQHLQECRRELPILAHPTAATSRWQLLFNPALADPGLMP